MGYKSCCFTGHRPEKLNMGKRHIKKLLKRAVKQSVKEGFTEFITGMSRGVDMWAAEIVLSLKKRNSKISLICAVPFKGFESRWEIKDKKLFESILKRADRVEYVCPCYSKSCFQIRNIYMVDRSEKVIAAYIGEQGGTKNTVDYAEKKHIEIINILKTDKNLI